MQSCLWQRLISHKPLHSIKTCYSFYYSLGNKKQGASDKHLSTLSSTQLLSNQPSLQLKKNAFIPSRQTSSIGLLNDTPLPLRSFPLHMPLPLKTFFLIFGCTGSFSCCGEQGPLFLWCVGFSWQCFSFAEHRIWALELQQLQHMGSVAAVHGLSGPEACGIFQTRNRTHVPCISRWILIHCATREAHLFSPNM